MASSDDYKVVMGGSLKLKNRALPGKAKKKKKKTKVIVNENPDGETVLVTRRGKEEIIVPKNRMTEAEKKFELQRQRAEAETVRKMAEKSHREKIAELNHQLDTISEH